MGRAVTVRPGFLIALVLAAVLAPILAWWTAATEAADRREARLVADARAAVAVEEQRLARRVAERLEALRQDESRRPWYHYQDRYNDPDAVAEGVALFPSPIADGRHPELVAGFVSATPGGGVWRSGWDESVIEGIASIEALGARAPSVGRGEVQILAGASYAQNVLPQGAAFPSPGARPGLTVAAAPVEVTVSPFEWTCLTTPAGAALVATRRVDLPASRRVQAFAVDRRSLEDWLRAAGPARIARSTPIGAPGALLGLGGCPWRVVLPDDAAVAAAEERAALVRSRSERTFLLGASLALLGALGAGLVVAQASRVARQRAMLATAAAHELRTPLAALRLHAELIASASDLEGARDRGRRVVQEASRLARIVSNILGATRLERGGLAVRLEDGDLAHAVAEIVGSQRELLEASGLAVSVEGCERPLPARFDREALAQVIGNLLDNADRHTRGTPDRRVAVTLIGTPVPRVVIHDSGPGLARGRSPFRRHGHGGDPSRGGLGLGLRIAREICRAMGGDLIASSHGPGATFTIELATAGTGGPFASRS